VQEVLREAISLGGSSISDYVDADGEEGFFQLQHRVYGREASPAWSAKLPSNASSSPAQQPLLPKVPEIGNGSWWFLPDAVR